MTLTYLAVFLFGAAVLLVMMRLWDWAQRLRKAPWAEPRSISVVGDRPGHSNVLFVSRHDLAEAAVICTRCGTVAAPQGDVSVVRRMLVNGRENEVIRCPGRFEHPDGTTEACGALLVASPDTEHGDDLIPGDPSVFYRFRRPERGRVVRDRYGSDAQSVDREGIVVIKAPVKPKVDPRASTEHLPAIKE